VSQYQIGKTNLDFAEARDSEWQWHQLDHMQTICTSLQTDNHNSTSSLNFLQVRCSSFSEIQIGFAFLVLADPGSPGKRAVKQNGCVWITRLNGYNLSGPI